MELLVTIIIIMILAGYAIFAYLDSIYEAENTQAKSKLEVINAGVARFRYEYPAVTLTGVFSNENPLQACLRTDTSMMRLVRCGYIPNMDFAAFKYSFHVIAPGAITVVCNCGVDSAGKAICDGYVYMLPKAGEDLGAYSSNRGYCAGISTMKGGKAADGEKVQ